jgi:hypothetical protein
MSSVFQKIITVWKRVSLLLDTLSLVLPHRGEERRRVAVQKGGDMKNQNSWPLRTFSKAVAGIFCVLTLLVSSVWALAVFNLYRTTPQVFTDNASHLLALNNVGVTSLNVSTTGTVQLVILFNAECTVDALDDSTYVDIDILVNGAAVPPSQGADSALCTSTGDGALQHWVSASMNVVKTVGAGTHTIQVRGTVRGFSAGDRWQIDDLSLIVMRQP